jgi:hypothetical protein
MNDIDFDMASACWRKNKKYMGKGYFVYICAYVHSNGKQCRRTVYSQLIKNPYANMYENFVDNNLLHHPNRDLFCKQHLNRG